MKTVTSREDFLREVLAITGEGCESVELGVLYGDFSQTILDILKPSFLILVDPFEVSEQKYKDGLATAYSTSIEYENIVKRFKGNEKVFIERSFSYDIVDNYGEDIFDFIYIDACHLYECVKRDLTDWLPKLKDGGIMAGHDYANISDFGVIRAVDEFCIEHGFEMIILNSNGGDWALKKKK